MFDKIKRQTIGKLSDGVKQKTDVVAGTLTDTIMDISETVQETAGEISRNVGDLVGLNDSGPSVTIDVVDTADQETMITTEDEVNNKKGALSSIVDEIKTRSQENSELTTLVENEKKRLKKERDAAREGNIFRRIKPIDNYISKKEVVRDEQALHAFKTAKQSEIYAARSARSKAFAKKNKKTIAGLTAGVIAALSVAGGVATHTNNVAMATSYDRGVSYILEENYASAADELVGINYNDAEELLSYSYTQMDIDEYKGKPEDFFASLELADDIENTDVKKQYSEARDEAKTATAVQKEILSIEIKSTEDLPKDKVNTIEKSIGKIKERYRKLIDTENLDTTSAIIYALDNNTEVGKLITEIEKLGDVTLDSETELKELRTRYDALSEKDKAIIFNYSTLTDAEGKYAALKAENDKKIAEEKAKKEAEEAKKRAEEKAKKEAEEEKKREEEAKKKEAALQAEAEAYAANARDNMTVWVTGTGKYHVDGCSYVRSYTESTYGRVKNSNSPCGHCHPDAAAERFYQNCVNEYIRNHSDE